MGSGPVEAERHHSTLSSRIYLLALIVVAGVALIYAARVVDRHTIQVVASERLLPRWDLATHLNHGWQDYHLLITGQIHRLLWDLWLQGYWPPVLSIYQVPFYLTLGGGLESGLRSALAALILVGILGCALMWRQWRESAALPAAVFLALLLSSPYLLAYASVTMTEIVGAAAELVVLLAYVSDRQSPTAGSARIFALSLTLLFFTKYNYFFLLVVPLVICEWAERMWNAHAAASREAVRRWTQWALSSPGAWLLAIYLVGLVIVLRTGGFDFHVAGTRVSVHTIGNSGHVVLYLLLARLWYLHRRGRIPWDRINAADPRVRPLLLWFAVPVTIWLASPYPNHIRDFFNLVVNRPLGESTIGGGAAIYIDALRNLYFFNQWLLALVVAVFAIAAIRYRAQPALMRWLIVAIPLQLAAIALHQTRFPRFLLLTVVLLCLAAATEVGGWCAGRRWTRIIGTAIAPCVLAVGVLAARTVVTQDRFKAVAFENYTDSSVIRAALDSIRSELKAEDRLAIVGQSNELSPALLRWEFGPPSGLPCSPFEIGGARGASLGAATNVLLMIPSGTKPAALDITAFYLAQRQTVFEEVSRGTFTVRRDFDVPDRHVSLRMYDRTSPPVAAAPCD